MKTINLLFGMCLMATLAIVGCGDDDGGTAGTGGGGTGGTAAGGGTGGGTGGTAVTGQLDRMGRPAINTALTQTFTNVNKDTRKDEYNAATPATWGTFAADFEPNLAIIDSLDGTCGNQLLAQADGSRYGLLASVLADDQIYVDSRQEASACGYLGVEAAAVLEGPESCGGRLLTDDVVDVSYTVLAAGPTALAPAPAVGDGVTNGSTFLPGFPFLGEPN